MNITFRLKGCNVVVFFKKKIHCFSLFPIQKPRLQNLNSLKNRSRSSYDYNLNKL